jgi:CRP/FNR family transcriptional regulator, cyclic AMP receptor protein
METLEHIISEHPFFAGLESYYTNLLTGCASNVRFDAGTYIFKEGEAANTFYLIRAGKVALEIFAPVCVEAARARHRTGACDCA